jgi:hypothetical protein
MCKKRFLVVAFSIVLNFSVYADSSNSGLAVSKPASPPALNSPTVGASAGSNQVFGYQKPAQKVDNKAYGSGNGSKKGNNRSTVGSRAGSEQVFGNQQLHSADSGDSQKSNHRGKTRNSPTVGSRAGSEQVFGH